MISFIDQHRSEYGVEPICAQLPIAESDLLLAQGARGGAGAIAAAGSARSRNLRPFHFLFRRRLRTPGLSPFGFCLRIPAFPRSRIISRSNSAKTESIPAIARPAAVVRSSG